MGLVWPVISSMLAGDFLLTLILYTVAGISDALDGFIAKHYNYISRLGSILDPLADKFLLVSTFCTLAWLGLAPLWIVAMIIARDVLILCGAGLFFLLIGRFEMAPSRISKINTVCQMGLGLLLVVTQIAPLDVLWVDYMIRLVAVTTALSGLHYVWVWGTRAFMIQRRRH